VNIYDEKFDPGNGEHFERINRILKNSSAITHEGSHVIDYFQVLCASPLTHAQADALRTDKSFAGNNLWNAQFRREDGSVLALQIGGSSQRCRRRRSASWVRTGICAPTCAHAAGHPAGLKA